MGIIIGPIFIVYIATAITCLLIIFSGLKNPSIGKMEWGLGFALLLAIVGGFFAVWKLLVRLLWFADAFWLSFAVLPIIGLLIVGVVVKLHVNPSPHFRFRAIVVLLSTSISPFVIFQLASNQLKFY